MDDKLAVRGAVAQRGWTGLPVEARRCIAAFGAGGPEARVPVTTPLGLPRLFADDVLGGGRRLREAFPQLERQLVAVRPGRECVVTVACAGIHTGTWYGLLSPSRRAIRFDEVHRLELDVDRVVRHVVVIDFSAIVRALSAPRPAAARAH